MCKTKVVVDKHLTQFSNTLKLVVPSNEECRQKLKEEKINNSHEWLH